MAAIRSLNQSIASLKGFRHACVHLGTHPGWTEALRNPLREAMDWLRDRIAAIYEKEATPYLRDPWGARDDYIELMLDRSTGRVEGFFAGHLRDTLASEGKERVIKLLEMQKNALLVYTSCGWFFDDIAGIEAAQVMRYAAKTMQLAEQVQGIRLEPDYIRVLEKAPSVGHGNGSKTYELVVRTSRRGPSRVIAG